jgi:DUF1680 family protein
MIATGVRARADALAQGHDGGKIESVVPMKAWAFPLEEVRLLDGPFKHAMDLDGAYLLALDTDRLVHNFRINAGLPSTAKPLGGWEAPSCELRGHFVGHYMTACAQMFAATGDERYKAKGRAIVEALHECQEKMGTGYLSAFPETFIDRVEQRKQVWAPYYTLHKIFAGLQDMYVYCQDAQALEMARKFGDWFVERTGKLTDEQIQALLQTEQGGMNETLANLYALTGEKKYLDASLRFNHHRVIDPLENGQDHLTGLHANTQIPKFIGLARQYELTGDSKLKEGALTFWDSVVSNRSYVIGGNSDGEMFTATNKIWQMGPNTTETCNTYNMLKLTRHLFCWDPQAVYADYYERALCNHILASQNPETGMMCYYVPLRTGSRKNFNTQNTDFWCCTGTGVENHGKYGDSIYFHGDDVLYLNLFIASQLGWKEKGLKIRQETRFPEEQHSAISFECENPVRLRLKIRRPAWAQEGFAILVNGQKAESGEAGAYATIDREWKQGDKIEIQMPFALREEAFAGKPDRAAVLDGPLVLAAEVDRRQPAAGVVGTPSAWLASLQPVVDKPETFRAAFRVPGRSEPETLTLEPFYKIYRHNYEVYWDDFTPEQWAQKEKEIADQAEQKHRIEARTVDSVNPGEEQNERDHNQKGEHSNAGDFGDHFYRDASENGWFSWDLKVLPGAPQELVLTYWGSDRGRQFDLLIDGKKLATERLNASHQGVYFEQTYPLPPELTQGRDKVTLRVQGSNTWVGGVFGVRVLKSGGT